MSRRIVIKSRSFQVYRGRNRAGQTNRSEKTILACKIGWSARRHGFCSGLFDLSDRNAKEGGVRGLTS